MPKRNGTGIALLADPTRREIIGLLALHPRRPSVIAPDDRPRAGRPRAVSCGCSREAGSIRVLPAAHDGRVALYAIEPAALGADHGLARRTAVGIEAAVT